MSPQHLPTFQLDERESATVELARKLLDYLLTGPFEPGQKLPSERQLAESLDIGRAAIREALKSLTLLGIVHQRHGGGTFLSSSTSDFLPRVVEWGLLLGVKQLDDIVELRTYLEPITAELAATRRTDEDLASLQSSIEEMKNSQTDFPAYVANDIKFHIAIGKASGNQALCDVMTSVRSLLDAWARRVIQTAGETESSLAVHLPVLRAIENRDPLAARAAMEAHMSRANVRLRASIDNERPDAPLAASHSTAVAPR